MLNSFAFKVIVVHKPSVEKALLDDKRRVQACITQNVSSKCDITLERYHNYTYVTVIYTY